MGWIVLLFACFGSADQSTPPSGGGASAPSGGGAAEDAEEAGDEAKPHVAILPGAITGPAPAPGEGITASQCAQMQDGGPLAQGSDFLTAEVKCGDVILGHTRGGVQKFNTKFYEKNFCTPGTTQHDGGDERIYRLPLKAQERARITLDTPCANLDVAAIQSSSGATQLPTEALGQRCEMVAKKGTTREVLDLYTDVDDTWFLVVEGQGDEEGAFALHIQCGNW